MSYQAGIAADIEENSKAWKMRANKIRGMRAEYKFEDKAGNVLKEIINYKVFNDYIKQFIGLENLSYKKINNDKYEIYTPNYKLVLERTNKRNTICYHTKLKRILT